MIVSIQKFGNKIIFLLFLVYSSIFNACPQLTCNVWWNIMGSVVKWGSEGEGIVDITNCLTCTQGNGMKGPVSNLAFSLMIIKCLFMRRI